MIFKNKNIIIVCQQDWGEMFVSKHHYAVELAKLDNNVYFLNGPDQRKILKKGEVQINESKYKNLFIVTHNLSFPYILKFKARWLYNFFIKKHINKILKKIDQDIDLIWSFDLSDTIPLRYFSGSYKKIFMPVDEPQDKTAIAAAKSADIILSVTNEIIEKYATYNIPKFSINHGVAEIFINKNISENTNNPIRVGLSGNFLRPDIDRETLLKIIESNPNVMFECWGPIDNTKSNLMITTDSGTLNFTGKLKSLSNVIAQGVVGSNILSEKIKQVDCFLICYDINKDQSKGTNYHKILEYLASGKVVVSNNVTAYKEDPDLVSMPLNRNNNYELPSLFLSVIKNIEKNNSIQKQAYRIDFAKNHLYSMQIKKIQTLLSSSLIKEADFHLV